MLRSESLDELRRERAGPAAHIEGPLPGPDAGEVCHLRGQQSRVATHEVVVGGGGHIEAHPPTLAPRALPDRRRAMPALYPFRHDPPRNRPVLP